MQLATYAGWRLHGLKGGLAAGLLFVLPGALLVLALAATYASFGEVTIVQAVFYGIKAAVVVIVVEALLRVAKRALKRPAHWGLAGLSFVALFFLSLPFPLVIAAAAACGFILARQHHPVASSAAPEVPVTLAQTATTVAAWASVWLLPLGALVLGLGWGHVLVQLGVFFSKLAIVTFGGAYAVLAYMAQEVVQSHGWLDAGEMLDGLGLAETTNGPLILVTEFVGYLAAYRSGNGSPALMGLAGAAVTLWVTFTPCFLWVFAGAPYIERLQRLPALRGALEGVMAAVVGVIFNLTVWFGLHVFFRIVEPASFGPFTLWAPDLGTVDWGAVILASIAALALFRLHLGLPVVLALSGALGLVWQSWG
jgi:chromate transporter